MANLVTFVKKLWKDATSGGTPITAAELNRMEGGINDCATQINKLGDSVSRKYEDVDSSYGTVSFSRNGSTAMVSASLKSSAPFPTNTWIKICKVPSWFNVSSYWVEAMSSNGQHAGIWSVESSFLSIFIHDATCTNVITSGVLQVV